MNRLRAINSKDDIPAQYRENSIGLLLEYHNLEREYESYANAELLVGMCMDNRKHLHIPDNFAFIIRSGGANLRYSEFKVSYAIAVGGVRSIALIGHNQCGMVNLVARKEQFVKGLTENAGWPLRQSEEHYGIQKLLWRPCYTELKTTDCTLFKRMQAEAADEDVYSRAPIARRFSHTCTSEEKQIRFYSNQFSGMNVNPQVLYDTRTNSL
jgi:carbonic anhydrase